MTLETRNFAISEVRAKDAATGRASGYAAVFNSDSADLGSFVERIAPGAFSRSLSATTAGTISIYALWAHDKSQPLGATRSGKLNLAEDHRGLAFDLDTTRFTAAQLDALADGDLQMSFGFIVREQDWREDRAGKVTRTIKDLDLTEISFVIDPAYPDTTAALRSLDAWKAEAIEVPTNTTYKIDVSPMTKRALDAVLRAKGL